LQLYGYGRGGEMFKQGDVIEIVEGAPYTVTKPGSQWLVYSLLDDDTLRIGPTSDGTRSNVQMIEAYGRDTSKLHKDRRIRDGVKIFSVAVSHCRISGNNALFKNVLSQGDPWEEEKRKPKFLSNSDLPF
jgi:hypothetical protein